MKEILKRIIVWVITKEAQMLLRRTKPQIVAVTGSVGKTSVKDAIYAVLKDHMHARKSEKSFNSEIGVPLSVLGLPNAWGNPFFWFKNMISGALMVLFPGEYPKLLVLEMGVDRPGDMEKLTGWIRPDIVVLTRLPDVPVHVEFFDSPEDVCSEKIKLVHALRSDGVFVYNQDDEKVAEVARGLLHQSIGYSRYSPSPFRTTDDHVLYKDGKATGYEFTLSHLSQSVRISILGSLGVQHTYTIAAAAAVASVFNIGIEEVAHSLQSYVTPPGRMRLIPGIKETLIIDDTYNSSPTASEHGLQTLREIKGVKRRIAVLGDMMELGQYSVREHERIGVFAAKCADVIVGVGVRARGFIQGALTAGMSEKKLLQYDDAVKAGVELQNFIKPGDVLLIKGSQSIRAERIVEELMAEPEQAEELLVRQGTAWKDV